MISKIIPVIHYADDAQALRNAERAFDADCDGVMLIQMQGRHSRRLATLAGEIKTRWPDRLAGINLLGTEPLLALRASMAAGLDMTWTDEQLTHSSGLQDDEADDVRGLLTGAPGHLMFVGVAFKHQRHEPDPGRAARDAARLGFVPTTSGSATGVAAEAGRIADLRDALGPDAPLGIASGITPDNVTAFAPYLTHILVATGVLAPSAGSGDEFDTVLLRDLVRAVRS